jgi:hypothetical protein
MLCIYAECHFLFIVTLNVIIVSVVMLNVIRLSDVAPRQYFLLAIISC